MAMERPVTHYGVALLLVLASFLPAWAIPDAAMRCAKISSDDGVSYTCLCQDPGLDRIFHDTDCDRTKDAGEEYIDIAAGAGTVAWTTIDTPLGTDPDADVLADTLILTSSGSTLTITGADDPESINFECVDVTCTACLTSTELATDSVGSDEIAAQSSATWAGEVTDETGTGLWMFNNSPTFVDDFTLAAAGVLVTGADGSVTFLGLGDGNDEDLKVDLDNGSANVVLVTSSTGVTHIDFGTINLMTDTIDFNGTGTINGLDAIDDTSEATLEGELDLLDLADNAAADTCSGGEIVRRNAGDTAFECAAASSGSSIILDLGDDDVNESTALAEIAITNDTNSIFTESTPDKLLIDVSADWPQADLADDLACTGCVSDTDLAADSVGSSEIQTAAVGADEIAAQSSATWAGEVTDETGTGLWIFNDSPTLVDDLTLAAAGVLMTGADGSITFLGKGDGNDEDLKLDLDNGAANVVLITSSTGVTDLDLGTIDLNTDTIDLNGTGTLNGLDVIDATGEATLEATLDIHGDLDCDNDMSSCDLDQVAVEAELEGELDMLDLADGAADTCTGTEVVRRNAGDTAFECVAASTFFTAWDDIADPDAAGTIVFAGFDQDITSAEDGGDILTMGTTDADQAADTKILRLYTNDTNDTNTIFLEGTTDEDGTPATDFRVKNTGTAGGLELILGATGVTVTTDGDGAITFLSRSAGAEDLTLNLDDTANVIVASSSTGVTRVDWGTIGADYGGATSNGLELPNGSSLDVTGSTGRIGVDPDDNGQSLSQLVFRDDDGDVIISDMEQRSLYVEDIISTDDRLGMLIAEQDITLVALGCVCSTSMTTFPDIILEDGAGNNVTGTESCSIDTSNASFTSLTAANTLVASEPLFAFVNNTPNPSGSSDCIITVVYKVTRR